MKDRIQSVVALRALAFLGIFFLHSGCPFQWSNFGVATFFVLSGFLLSYRYQDTVIRGGCKGSLRFAVKHIKKIYPLHIVTMMTVLILNVVELIVMHRFSVVEIGKLGFKIVLNVLLMQSWFPSVSVNVSLNGVAWFLSSILFCYFMFPMLHKLFRNRGQKSLGAIAMTILLLQFGITAVLVWLNITEDILRWATYDAPFFRLGDFAIGAIAGTIVARNKMKTLKHGKALIIIVVLFGIMVNIWDAFSSHGSFISQVLNNYTTIYIPIATILVVLFSFEREFLSNSKVLMFIGENSYYYFLVHYAVIKIMKSMMRMNGIEPNKYWSIVLIVAAGLTVMFTELYKKVEKSLNCRLRIE